MYLRFTFTGKKVTEVGVGCMHVVVLTEEGEVYVWGRNDQAQLGDAPHVALAEPTLMSSLHGKNIIGIACGPSQVRQDVLLFLYSI